MLCLRYVEGGEKMREILFRGKRLDNGEWVYGFYSMQNLNHGFVPVIIQFDGGSTMPAAVIPETVGQYIELKDKNGIKIFEGDILHCISRFDRANMVVLFEEGEFRLVLCEKYLSYEMGGGFSHVGCFEKKVIGNIYDNPELLEEKT